MPESVEGRVLHGLRRLLELRMASPALSGSDMQVVRLDDRYLIAFLRRGEADRLLVVANLSEHRVVVPGATTLRQTGACTWWRQRSWRPPRWRRDGTAGRSAAPVAASMVVFVGLVPVGTRWNAAGATMAAIAAAGGVVMAPPIGSAARVAASMVVFVGVVAAGTRGNAAARPWPDRRRGGVVMAPPIKGAASVAVFSSVVVFVGVVAAARGNAAGATMAAIAAGVAS